MIIPITEEKYRDSEINIICRSYKKPKLTVWEISEIFGDEDTLTLVKKKINILTRQKNKLTKPLHIIDLNIRWVVNGVNKHKAALIEKEIKKQKLLLSIIQSKVDEENGVVPKESNKQGVNDVEILKAREVPIKELMESYGVEFKRDFAECPWHIEKSGSLHYIKKRNTTHCHGGCSRSYDTIDVVMHFNNYGFIDAVKMLSN